VIRRRLCPSSYNFLGVAIPKKVLWEGFAKKIENHVINQTNNLGFSVHIRGYGKGK
jgi:hypothetical protein